MARAFGVRKSDFLHANTFESEPILGALFAFLLMNIVVMLFACYRAGYQDKPVFEWQYGGKLILSQTCPMIAPTIHLMLPAEEHGVSRLRETLDTPRHVADSSSLPHDREQELDAATTSQWLQCARPRGARRAVLAQLAPGHRAGCT